MVLYPRSINQIIKYILSTQQRMSKNVFKSYLFKKYSMYRILHASLCVICIAPNSFKKVISTYQRYVQNTLNI